MFCSIRIKEGGPLSSAPTVSNHTVKAYNKIHYRRQRNTHFSTPSHLSWTALRHALEAWLIFFPPQIESVSLSPFSYIHLSTHKHSNSVCLSINPCVESGSSSSRNMYDEALSIVFSYGFFFFIAAPVPALWQQWHFSPEAMFYVSALTLQWPSVWVVSVQKGFVVRNSSEIKKVPLKQKHQEKPSSSPVAHTRLLVSVSVYLWSHFLSLNVWFIYFF